MEDERVEQDNRVKEAEDQVREAEKARDAAIKKQKYTENLLNSSQFEFESWQSKAKARENELIEQLQEIRGEQSSAIQVNAQETSDNKELMDQLEQQLTASRKELEESNETVRLTIERLQQDLNEGQQKIREFETTVAALEAQKEQMNLKLQSVAELKIQLQASENNLSDDLKAGDARDELATVQQTCIDELQEMLNVERAQFQTLEQQMQDVKAQNSLLSERAATADRFEQELTIERQRIKEALIELNELRTANVELKEKVASVFVLERDLTEEKAKSGELQSEIERLHGINSDLNIKIFTVESREQELELEKKKLDWKQDKLDHIATLEIQLSDTSEQLRIMTASFNDAQLLNNQLVEKLNSIKSEVNKATKTPKKGMPALIEFLKQTLADSDSYLHKSMNGTVDSTDLAGDFTFNSTNYCEELESTLCGNFDNSYSVANGNKSFDLFDVSKQQVDSTKISQLEGQILRLSQAKQELESKVAAAELKNAEYVEKLSNHIDELVSDKFKLSQELAAERVKHEEDDNKARPSCSPDGC